MGPCELGSTSQAGISTYKITGILNIQNNWHQFNYKPFGGLSTTLHNNSFIHAFCRASTRLQDKNNQTFVTKQINEFASGMFLK